MGGLPVRTSPEPSIRFNWRDLLALDMRDPDLRSRTENFLDLFQRTRFPHTTVDAGTGHTRAGSISGQDYLERISKLKDVYDVSSLSTMLTSRGMMHGGRFIIAQHNRPYDGTSEEGAAPVWMGRHKPDPWPVGIEIGAPYLKSERVSVDAALTKTLTQLAFQTTDEKIADDAADVVVGALRGSGKSRSIDFNDNSSGYLSYADKFGKSKIQLDFLDSSRDIGTRLAAALRGPELRVLDLF
jgi:hypothetical protein